MAFPPVISFTRTWEPAIPAGCKFGDQRGRIAYVYRGDMRDAIRFSAS